MGGLCECPEGSHNDSEVKVYQKKDRISKNYNSECHEENANLLRQSSRAQFRSKKEESKKILSIDNKVSFIINQNYNDDCDSFTRKNSFNSKFNIISANNTELGNDEICNQTLTAINEFKLDPFSFLKNIEKVYSHESFKYSANIDTISKQSENNLIKEYSDNFEFFDNNNDETNVSLKDLRYKELVHKLNEISKHFNHNVILRSEKLNMHINQFFKEKYLYQNDEILEDFLKSKFDQSFIVLTWNSIKDPYYSITSLLFNSLDNLVFLLTRSFTVGSVYAKNSETNNNTWEFHLILAS